MTGAENGVAGAEGIRKSPTDGIQQVQGIGLSVTLLVSNICLLVFDFAVLPTSKARKQGNRGNQGCSNNDITQTKPICVCTIDTV